jgi:hypothetical protein
MKMLIQRNMDRPSCKCLPLKRTSEPTSFGRKRVPPWLSWSISKNWVPPPVNSVSGGFKVITKLHDDASRCLPSPDIFPGEHSYLAINAAPEHFRFGEECKYKIFE